MIITLWAIWWARRKAIHEDIFQNPATHGFVSSYMTEIEILQKPAMVRPQAPVIRQNHWVPPPVDHAKINVDATVSRSGGFGSVGAICRDHEGTFLGASRILFPFIDDPSTLEALATHEALALAEDLYVQRTVVASDCTVIIDAIKVGSAASYGAVVHEIIDRSSSFASCDFQPEFRGSQPRKACSFFGGWPPCLVRSNPKTLASSL